MQRHSMEVALYFVHYSIDITCDCMCIPIVHDYADMHLSNSIQFKFVLLFSLNLFFAKVKCCTIFTICMESMTIDYAVGWSNC